MSRHHAVLIADDDAIQQAVIGAMVNKMGFTVLAAYDGIQAIQLFEEHEGNICCVLLDIQMPKMNGIEVLKNWRKMGKDVAVIIVSGYLDTAKRAQLAPLHPRGYLIKPVYYQELSAELASIIEMNKEV